MNMYDFKVGEPAIAFSFFGDEQIPGKIIGVKRNSVEVVFSGWGCRTRFRKRYDDETNTHLSSARNDVILFPSWQKVEEYLEYDQLTSWISKNITERIERAGVMPLSLIQLRAIKEALVGLLEEENHG